MIREILTRYNNSPISTKVLLSFIFRTHFFIIIMGIASIATPGIIKQLHIVRFAFGESEWIYYQYAGLYILFFIVATAIYVFYPTGHSVTQNKSLLTDEPVISSVLKDLIDKIRAYEEESMMYREESQALLLETYRKRRMLREILDLVPLFIFGKDEEGRFFIVNRALASCYGVLPKEMIGKTDADFNPDTEEVNKFREADLKILRSGKPMFNIKEKVTCATGNEKHLLTNKIPFQTWDGRAAILGVSQDISPGFDCYKDLLEEFERFFQNKACFDRWDAVTDNMEALAETGYHD